MEKNYIAKATCVRFSKHLKEHLMKSPGVISWIEQGSLL